MGGKIIGSYNFLLYILGIYKLSTIDVNLFYHRLNGHGFGWTLGVGDGTGRPGVLWFIGSQRVGHDWVAELNWNGLLMANVIANVLKTTLGRKEISISTTSKYGLGAKDKQNT